MSYTNSPQHNSNVHRHPSSSPVMQRAVIPASNTGGPTPFKAPAHKHAHHLHSIPPREKSTRTLIIDHLLWVHARTRFAQARAELGMTDRTGGSHSANYAHRERPENFEEDEEVYSDGEEVTTLMARAGGPGHRHSDEEDERFDMQDLILARNLRVRAESVEKVATSMLDQPPAVPPIHPDDLLDTPTSPPLRPQNQPQIQHILPNGVRLRLALATVVNDLFSRRAPSPPSHLKPSIAASAALPSALVPLFAISSAPPHLLAGPSAHRRSFPSEYIRSLYAVGTDPDAQNSPPSLRCPRHLHMGCEICVEAKTQPTSRGGVSRGRSTSGRAGSTTGSSPGEAGASSNHANALVGGVTGWQDGSGIGSGLVRPGQRGTVLRRPSDAQAAGDANGQGGRAAMANTKLAELIVRFMRISALVAIELGREALEDRASVEGGDHVEASAPTPAAGSSGDGRRPETASPQTSPRTLTQRHLADAGLHYYALRPTREWYFLLAGLLTRAVFEGYLTAGWRGIEPLELLLGVGLGITQTRSPASEDRMRAPKEQKDDDPFDFDRFDPDDFPSLDDAAKVLFPSLRDASAAGPNGTGHYRREGAELEYQEEMHERLSRFYDVPGSTPDLATHMEDLAWQYPAEVVERASVRFCEAVARWRGKPELETYKKAEWIVGKKERRTSGGTAMSIDALVHSNPTSPSNDTPTSDGQTPGRLLEPKSRKPPIEKYFSFPQSLLMHGRKRRRSADHADEGRRALGQIFA